MFVMSTITGRIVTTVWVPATPKPVLGWSSSEGTPRQHQQNFLIEVDYNRILISDALASGWRVFDGAPSQSTRG